MYRPTIWSATSSGAILTLTTAVLLFGAGPVGAPSAWADTASHRPGTDPPWDGPDPFTDDPGWAWPDDIDPGASMAPPPGQSPPAPHHTAPQPPQFAPPYHAPPQHATGHHATTQHKKPHKHHTAQPHKHHTAHAHKHHTAHAHKHRPVPSRLPRGERNRMLAAPIVAHRGWSKRQYGCLNRLWTRESGWNHRARNPRSGAYGIPQALPAGKMHSAGRDWRSNPRTQIKWGLGYIAKRYGTPCRAWQHARRTGWY